VAKPRPSRRNSARSSIDNGLNYTPEPSSWDLAEELQPKFAEESASAQSRVRLEESLRNAEKEEEHSATSKNRIQSDVGKHRQNIPDKARVRKVPLDILPYTPEPTSWDVEKEERIAKKTTNVNFLPFTPEPTSWDLEEVDLSRRRRSSLISGNLPNNRHRNASWPTHNSSVSNRRSLRSAERQKGRDNLRKIIRGERLDPFNKSDPSWENELDSRPFRLKAQQVHYICFFSFLLNKYCWSCQKALMMKCH
jgi:hypothetical protein